MYVPPTGGPTLANMALLKHGMTIDARPPKGKAAALSGEKTQRTRADKTSERIYILYTKGKGADAHFERFYYIPDRPTGYSYVYAVVQGASLYDGALRRGSASRIRRNRRLPYGPCLAREGGRSMGS